jgi:hypothetical protein
MVPEVKKTDQQWREELSAEQHRVLRQAGPRVLSPGSTGITTGTACTAAAGVAPNCSRHAPSSTQARAGPASTSRLTATPWRRHGTGRW